MHVPLPEIMNISKFKNLRGERGEYSCCPTFNTHSYEVFKENKIKSIFSGHDHKNFYYGDYEGILMGYGRLTGFNAYGNLLRGATIFDLEEVKETDKERDIKIKVSMIDERLFEFTPKKTSLWQKLINL